MSEMVPVGVRLTREQIARLSAEAESIGQAVREAVDFWLRGGPELITSRQAADILGVRLSNFYKLPGRPDPFFAPDPGAKGVTSLYDAGPIRALAAEREAERARREAGCGHEPLELNAAGRCKRCEVERVREYKQAQKAAA